MKRFIATLRSAIVMVLIMTLLLGGIYPLAVMVLSQTLFNHRAHGSLLERGDKVVASSLLGQHFENPKYFWGRLSATTPPYNAAASTGSNLSPANPKLLGAANVRIAALQKSGLHPKKPIPVDLITASASGLDPHISLAAALYQLPRVAKMRDMNESEVKAMVEKHKEVPLFGLVGRPYVNVVRLNMALDDVANPAPKEKR